MMNRTIGVICVALSQLLAGSALAADQHGCGQLRGMGAKSTGLPPYQAVLRIFECADMTENVEALDALDRDIMVGRAKRLSLEDLREQQTKTDPPRKYSVLASAERLAKFKRLVDAYYRPK